MYLDELVAAILAKPGPLRLVAVDGPGGAGQVHVRPRAVRGGRRRTGGAHRRLRSCRQPDRLVATAPRTSHRAVARGDAAHYQRYDWPSETLAEWHTIEPAPIVIIEGVSAGRSEWAAHLSFLIWIETPREERLRRGVDRDGIAALDDWESWMAGEDAHYERDPTRERSDVVIDGTQPVERSRTDRHA
jgi:hypothetical protein